MFHSNRTGSPITGVTSVSPFKITLISTEERDPNIPYVSPVLHPYKYIPDVVYHRICSGCGQPIKLEGWSRFGELGCGTGRSVHVKSTCKYIWRGDMICYGTLMIKMENNLFGCGKAGVSEFWFEAKTFRFWPIRLLTSGQEVRA